MYMGQMQANRASLDVASCLAWASGDESPVSKLRTSMTGSFRQ